MSRKKKNKEPISRGRHEVEEQVRNAEHVRFMILHDQIAERRRNSKKTPPSTPPPSGLGVLGKAPKLTLKPSAGRSGVDRISVANTRSTSSKIARMYKGFRRGSTWGQRPGARVSTIGGKVRAVVKSRYQRNRPGEVRDKLEKHLGYLQDRPGAEFEKQTERKFYTKDRSDVPRRDVASEVEKKFGTPAAYHKIILSPGDNSVNLNDYTRQVMEDWQKAIGREFQWWAINHYNTDHYHSHVIVAGRDEKNRHLKFDREMLAECREVSDRYLCRDREFDRDLDRIADIHTNQMMRRFDYTEKLAELFISRPVQWQQQVDLGLKTDDEYYKEWEDLGLNKIYELGRPFEGIRQVSKEQVARELAEKEAKERGTDENTNENSLTRDSSNSEKQSLDTTQDASKTGGENPGQTQPGGWLQQQNTVIAEPAATPFGHDVRERDSDDRDDDDGSRITAKGRI